jgi:hypothetical protein
MSIRQTPLVFVALVCMVSQPTAAQAQAPAISTCMSILWNYVGKPMTAAIAERAGGAIADYFLGKLQNNPSGSVKVTENDIRNVVQQYEQQGSSECEARQQFDAMYNYQYSPQPQYPWPTMPSQIPGPPCLAKVSLRSA